MKIGLEVHVHPKTLSKLFCKCPASSKTPNEAVCPICTAQPGAKPMAPNEEAIKKTIMLSELLGCRISSKIRFLRKHYFYPDLPAGFQRTSTPIGVNGTLAGVRIREVHLEEDAGRYDPRKRVVDYSRAGVPLIEIVTEPDMKSKEDVRRFLKALVDVLEYSGIWKDKLIRADVNITVDKGEKVEVKEVSTFKGILKVIELEGKEPSKTRVTKHYDETRQETFTAREKELEEDYRFIQDPDIPEILIQKFGLRPYEELLKSMVDLGLPAGAARTILVNGLSTAYKKMRKRMTTSEITEWVPVILGELRFRGIQPRTFKLDDDFFMIINALREKKITKPQAVSMLRDLLDKKQVKPQQVILEEKIVKEVIKGVIKEEKNAVEKYLKGKKTVIHYLVGVVVRKSKGAIPPALAKKKLEEALTEDNLNDHKK